MSEFKQLSRSVKGLTVLETGAARTARGACFVFCLVFFCLVEERKKRKDRKNEETSKKK